MELNELFNFKYLIIAVIFIISAGKSLNEFINEGDNDKVVPK